MSHLVRVRLRSALGVFAALAVALAVFGVAPASSAPTGGGYWLLGADGGVFSFGAPFHGSGVAAGRCAPNITDRFLPTGTCSSVAATVSGGGYWVLNQDRGTVSRFGDAAAYGDPGARFAGVPRDLWPSFRQIVATPSGHGYWVLQLNLSNAATIDPFGDAKNYGDSQTLVAKTHTSFVGTPVGMVSTPTGRGYWEVHSDGGVLSFGDAPFFGSLGGMHLSSPIVGMAMPPDGTGYWLAAADGQVYAFGHVTPAKLPVAPAQPVVGIVANPIGPGFWLVARDGGVFALAGAPFRGSMGGSHLNAPVVAMAGRPAP